MPERFDTDRPPHSRIFLTCRADMTAEKLRETFAKFGAVEDLWQVRSKKAGAADVQPPQSTSLWYIKYSKSSSALSAIEEMNGKAIEEGEQPTKVMMAFNRQETTVYRGRDGTDTLERIFFHVTDEDTVEILRDEFSQYGTIADCVILRRRYAYISFSRPLEAARAIEGCEAKSSRYKPVVAEQPKARKRESDRLSGGGPPPKYGAYHGESTAPPHNDYGGSSAAPGRVYQSSQPSAPYRNGSSSGGDYYQQDPYPNPNYGRPIPASSAPVARLPEGCIDLSSALINNPTRCTKLFLRVNYPLSRESVFKLCNVIPMLENVELHREATALQKTIALISYNNATAAGLAWQKFQDFEYPPGNPLRLRYADAGFPTEWQFELGLKHGYPFPTTEYTASYQTLAGGGPLPPVVEYSPQMFGGGGFATPARRGSPGGAPRGAGLLHNEVIYQSAVDSGPMAPPHQQQRPDRSTITLEAPKPPLPRSTPYTDRCFFYTSNRLPQQHLEEIFASFGDFIDAYYLPQKNCGYALFGSPDAANKAIQTLNGEIFFGEHFKIVRADPEPKIDL